VVKAIARVFFLSGSREALARLEHTAKYFLPLRGESVVFVLVCIAFALEEYLTGKRVPAKFEGLKVDSKLTNFLL
jgi:Domain of unknown function (DUF6532)